MCVCVCVSGWVCVEAHQTLSLRTVVRCSQPRDKNFRFFLVHLCATMCVLPNARTSQNANSLWKQPRTTSAPLLSDPKSDENVNGHKNKGEFTGKSCAPYPATDLTHPCMLAVFEPGLTARLGVTRTDTNIVRSASHGIDMDAHEPSWAIIAPVGGARPCTPLDRCAQPRALRGCFVVEHTVEGERSRGSEPLRSFWAC